MRKPVHASIVCLVVVLTGVACGKDAPAQAANPSGSSGSGTTQASASVAGAGKPAVSDMASSVSSAGRAGQSSSATSAGKGDSAGAPAAGSGAGGPATPAAVGGMGGADMLAAAGAPAAMAASADPDPSPGCMGTSLMPGESMQMLESGGKSRLYVQHVPKLYDGKKPVPVVLDLHGGSYTGPRWVNVSGFKELSETEDFIVLFPSGTDSSWQATDADSSDGQFIRDLIGEIGKKACIDRKRVYSTGCSMGGAMSFWMGCFASDLIAAIAPDCGTPFFKLAECKPKHPISVMLTIGETDNLNCWEGMPGSVGNPCAKDVQTAFKEIDGCMGDFKKTHDGVCETLDQCAQGTEVTICKSNTGHGVYTATNMKVSEEGWSFLKRFYLQ